MAFPPPDPDDFAPLPAPRWWHNYIFGFAVALPTTGLLYVAGRGLGLWQLG